MKCPNCQHEINIGAVMGSATSARKKISSALNAAKGGRPKRIQTENGVVLKYRADLSDEQMDKAFVKYPDAMMIQVPRGFFVRD